MLDRIGSRVEPLDWRSNTGKKLRGVLHQQDGRVFLTVNSKNLKDTLRFEYIYRKDSSGNRRVLYTHDKFIPQTDISESWLVEVSAIIDEPYYVKENIKDIGLTRLVVFSYDSFLCESVPKTKEEKDKHSTILEQIENIDTSIGRISVRLPISNGGSHHPGKVQKSMDTISINIETKPMSLNDLLMWNARFSQLLSLIHKERVVLRSIDDGVNSVLIPSLVEDYSEASYAFRSPIGLSDFATTIKEILQKFVDDYDKVASFLEDLTEYYRDYPLNPPDRIQLLRLFTALEQVATHAQKMEKILSTELDKEQKKRKNEFDVLLKVIKQNSDIEKSVKEYLGNTKAFYISSGNLAAPKNKVVALASHMQNEYGSWSYLTQVSNVELLLKMRHMVAHGHYDGDLHDEFYKHRDDLGQAAEQCIRMYSMRALGASKETVLRHKAPLKARQFKIEPRSSNAN